jgi:predicted nuclease with TOPRIM domain
MTTADVRDAHERALKDVEHLKERQAQIREKFEKYTRMNAEIGPLLANAIHKLNVLQRQVDQIDAHKLRAELETVLDRLTAKWSTEDERRVFELFSALKLAGWCGGRDWMSVKLYVDGIKEPRGRIRRSWKGLLLWVNEPKDKAA